MGHEPFEKRLDWLKSTFMRLNGECREKHVRVVDQMKAKSREHVLEMLKDIEEMGGEGLMLRKPESYVLVFVLLSPCRTQCDVLTARRVPTPF